MPRGRLCRGFSQEIWLDTIDELRLELRDRYGEEGEEIGWGLLIRIKEIHANNPVPKGTGETSQVAPLIGGVSCGEGGGIHLGARM